MMTLHGCCIDNNDKEMRAEHFNTWHATNNKYSGFNKAVFLMMRVCLKYRYLEIQISLNILVCKK